MSIIDGQRNQKGVQRLGTEWANTRFAGDGCLVRHTNGRMYAIFARDFNEEVIERRLYFSWSVDGITWSDALQLTTGSFADEPTAIQLDTGDIASVIGVVYNSMPSPAGVASPTTTLRRFTVDVDGVVQTPFDSLGVATAHSPCLVKTAAGFTVFVKSTSPSPAVQSTTNTVFVNNSWTALANVGAANFLGASTNQIYDLSVTLMANGHLCLLACARTALDGSATNTAALGNVSNGIVRSDVFAVFSDDDGATWGTPQNLTNYTGTPAMDLIGIASAISAIGFDLSDGTVAVAFQEGIASQVINTATTLALPATPGTAKTVVYHAGHNLLIAAYDSTSGGDGGLLIYDLTAQTRTRLHTGSTPALWVNKCIDLALSSDDKYLAVASNGSLDIIDTTDANIANWTVEGIRTTSTPATKGDNMKQCRFASTGYNLFVSYGGAPSASFIWGFKLDASDSGAGITDLKYVLNGFAAVSNFYLRSASSDIIIAYNATLESVLQSSGLSNYASAIANHTFVNLIYDDTTGETLVGSNYFSSPTTNDGWWRVLDSGSVFTLGTDFLTPGSTNPTSPASEGPGEVQIFPGIGAMVKGGEAGEHDWYSFAEQTFYGASHVKSWQGSNEYYVNNGNQRLPPSPLKGDWDAQIDSELLAFNYVSKRGRIRWAVYPYVTGTKQLTVAGVDFYDLLNTVRLDSTSPLAIRRFGLGRDASDLIFGYFSRYDNARTTQISAALNGTVEPDAYKLSMLARIQNTYTQTLLARARVSAVYTQTLDTRARIVFAQCLKIQARIVPFTLQSLQVRAAIAAGRQSLLLIDYDVQAARQAKIRLIFSAQTGYTGGQTIQVLARIAPVHKKRFTGYFLVSGQQAVRAFGFTNSIIYQHTLAVRAFVRK